MMTTTTTTTTNNGGDGGDDGDVVDGKRSFLDKNDSRCKEDRRRGARR